MTVTIPEKVGVAAGFRFDLSLTWIDTGGARWTWTGETDHTGMAMMRTGDDTPERLSHVYWWSGPLVPAPREITAAERHAAIAAPVPTPRTVAGILRRRRGRGVSA